MHRSKFITALLIISILFSLASCGGNQQQEETIKVGMECNYAPFNWTQSNETATSVPIDSVPGAYADGYDVQMARKIAEGLGKKLVIVKLEWDGLTPALVAGDIDLIIAGMSPTAERKLTIDFTDAYYASELVVVIRKDSQYASADSLDDFAGAVITGQLNTVHYDVIDQMEGVTKENAMETFPAMIVALTSGKIDGYISELPGAVSAAAANSDLTYVRFAEGQGFVAAEEDITVAVGVRKGETELINSINDILASISGDERQKMMQDAVSNQPLSDM
ncbi:MAG: transporter substrate-binding domain-containing protein [Eubacteriales bacterium]|nr:transporter substrate-binding domain-containing protein [Eubacteriales bacterium]